jgi:hypothetical protein
MFWVDNAYDNVLMCVRKHFRVTVKEPGNLPAAKGMRRGAVCEHTNTYYTI